MILKKVPTLNIDMDHRYRHYLRHCRRYYIILKYTSFYTSKEQKISYNPKFGKNRNTVEQIRSGAAYVSVILTVRQRAYTAANRLILFS